MNTALTIHEPQPPAPAGTVGGNLIREAAAVMADAHRLAEAICNTQMVPKHFQSKPDECAAAMLYGASLGLDPMQAVKNIYVVHGTAGLYARAMVALVQRHGHEVWTVNTSDDQVTVAARRKGSEHVETSTWTYARAERAGYVSNAKYKTDPQAMLYAKAASEVCRKVAPDALNGVFAVEELQMERVESVRVDAPRRGLAAALPPAVDDGVADVGDAAVMLDTGSSLAKQMFALFGELGFTDKAARLAYVSDVVGRTIETSKDMTEDDAKSVIVAIRADLNTPEDGDPA